MTSHERVMAACAFQRPDRIPRFDNFWEYPDSWRKRLGPPENLTDISVWYPIEGFFPSRARLLREDGDSIIEVDEWGRTIRRRRDAYFSQVLEAPLAGDVDPESIEFDDPALDRRYSRGRMTPEVDFGSPDAAKEALETEKSHHCVFGKTGGPFLRSSFARGETQFLLDLAADPSLARAIANKVGEHLTRVGLEQLHRWRLKDTGIWIYDDMAFNHGPLFSPQQFEEALLPAYRRMIRAYKEAGARYVFLHSDGDIRPILAMLVDAGIDGLNPLERRANMDIASVRAVYPQLILTGGMCNTRTLISGTPGEIEAEAREIIDMGRDGGIVIGSHSVSPEIPLENFLVYHECCLNYGCFS